MYAIIQSRFSQPKSFDTTLNQFTFGITDKNNYRNLSGTVNSISFNKMSDALKELTREEFPEVDVGFYLILE